MYIITLSNGVVYAITDDKDDVARLQLEAAEYQHED